MTAGNWVAVAAGAGVGVLIAPFILSMGIDLLKAWRHVVTEELPRAWRKR